MRIGDTLYNLDGLPFRSELTATRMRDVLVGETGKPYRLESCPDGGFVIRQEHPPVSSVVNADPVNPAPQRADRVIPDQQGSGPEFLADYNLRPAVIRTNLLSLAIMGAALLLVLIPDSLLTALFRGLALSPRTMTIWWDRSLDAMTVTGAVLVLVLWIGLLWQRAGALYRVTGFGVEARMGIIAHQTMSLRFQDIRSMTLRQSLTDRLLNVGLLEFTSAGTDGAPVQFKQIAHPNQVLRLVKSRMADIASAD